MVIRYCSFATRGYLWRRRMQMMSLKWVDPKVELSRWNIRRLERAGIREEVPWFDPTLQGCSYWCWKPFVMMKELETMRDGDYLLYTDAGRPPGRLFHHTLGAFVQWLEDKGQDIMPGVNISWYTGDLTRWCKQDVFDTLQLNADDFLKAPLVQGSFLFVKKSQSSVALIREWMDLCRDRRLVASASEEERNRSRSNFAAHTNDQTLMSLLVKTHALDCLSSEKGIIHLEGRKAFEKNAGFDDKNPDIFLGKLGAVKVDNRVLRCLGFIQKATYFYERAVNKMSKKLGLGTRRGFY